MPRILLQRILLALEHCSFIVPDLQGTSSNQLLMPSFHAVSPSPRTEWSRTLWPRCSGTRHESCHMMEHIRNCRNHTKISATVSPYLPRGQCGYFFFVWKANSAASWGAHLQQAIQPLSSCSVLLIANGRFLPIFPETKKYCLWSFACRDSE